jgi:hypothetical protein
MSICIIPQSRMYCLDIIIIIIGKDTVSFMQGIYTYIPETNHVPKEYSVTAILSLLFVVPISVAPAFAVMYLLLLLLLLLNCNWVDTRWQ